jgi:hypothetical protein
MVFGISFAFSSFWIFAQPGSEMVKINNIYMSEIENMAKMEGGNDKLFSVQNDITTAENFVITDSFKEETKSFLNKIEQECNKYGIINCFDKYKRTERMSKEFFKIVAVILYYVLPTFWFGQTLGKWALKIKVVSQSGAIKLTLGQALARDVLGIFFFLSYFVYFGYSIPGVTLVVMLISTAYIFGLVRSLFTATKTTLGDTMGQTIVVQQVNQNLE